MSKEKKERRQLMHRAKDPLRETKDIRFDGLEQNPRWFKPVMFGLFILGFGWILTYSISQGEYPFSAIGTWNMLGGFVMVIAGFIMSTQWK